MAEARLRYAQILSLVSPRWSFLQLKVDGWIEIYSNIMGHKTLIGALILNKITCKVIGKTRILVTTSLLIAV